MIFAEPPEKGTPFYIPSFCTPEYAVHRIWYGHDEDMRILGIGMAWKKKEDAAAFARHHSGPRGATGGDGPDMRPMAGI